VTRRFELPDDLTPEERHRREVAAEAWGEAERDGDHEPVYGDPELF
jgi:hypothetical protein